MVALSEDRVGAAEKTAGMALSWRICADVDFVLEYDREG